ncbi:MAG: hypothetical protein AAF495_02515 [Pseudomonadota bacterium]
MSKAASALGQILVYGVIALTLGIFANGPTYQRFPDDKAQIVLSFSHGAQRKGGCRRLSAEEIAELPANMKRLEICPRERLPVLVELQFDGELLFEARLAPTGLSGDGRSQVYRRFEVPPGTHRLVARLRDSERDQGFDYEREETIELSVGQSLVIDFRSEMGGFLFAGGTEDRPEVSS